MSTGGPYTEKASDEVMHVTGAGRGAVAFR